MTVVGARYHAACCKNLHKNPTEEKFARPICDEIDKVMNDIFDFIEENADKCQFTISHLMKQIKGDYTPHDATVKQPLVSKYENGIVLFEAKGITPIVCFKNVTGYKLLAVIRI